MLDFSSISAHCLGLKFRKKYWSLLPNGYPWCLHNFFDDHYQLLHEQSISLEGFFEFQLLIFCSKVEISFRYLVDLIFPESFNTDNIFMVSGWSRGILKAIEQNFAHKLSKFCSFIAPCLTPCHSSQNTPIYKRKYFSETPLFWQ